MWCQKMPLHGITTPLHNHVLSCEYADTGRSALMGSAAEHQVKIADIERNAADTLRQHALDAGILPRHRFPCVADVHFAYLL